MFHHVLSEYGNLFQKQYVASEMILSHAHLYTIEKRKETNDTAEAEYI